MSEPAPDTARKAALPPPRNWWAWPLRFSVQCFVALYAWKLYGCMRIDCTDHTPGEKLFAHLVMAGLAAACVEIVLLVNRALDDEPA